MEVLPYDAIISVERIFIRPGICGRCKSSCKENVKIDMRVSQWTEPRIEFRFQVLRSTEKYLKSCSENTICILHYVCVTSFRVYEAYLYAQNHRNEYTIRYDANKN